VWDLRSGPHLVRTLDSGEFPIRHLHVIGGAELCVASSSNAFSIWNLMTGTQVRSVIHAPTITAFDATPNGKWIITGSADGALRLFDADDGQQRVQLDNPHGITAVAITDDGRFAASATRDRTLSLWDLNTGISRKVMMVNTNRVMFTQSGRLLLAKI